MMDDLVKLSLSVITYLITEPWLCKPFYAICRKLHFFKLKKPGHGSRSVLQKKLQIVNDWHILPYVYFYAFRSLRGRAVALRSVAGLKPRLIRVGFVVYVVSVTLVRLLRLGSVKVIPPKPRTHSTIC